MENKIPQTRPEILQQLAQIDTMERGTLAEEYREKPNAGGGTVRLGPYFKHQVWEGGANHSRRVPAEEVSALRQDLENHSRFTQLVESYEKTVIAETRAQRSALMADADPDSKKNSRSKRPGSATPKPKRSSK